METVLSSISSGPRKARTAEKDFGAAGRPGSHVKLYVCSKGRKFEHQGFNANTINSAT